MQFLHIDLELVQQAGLCALCRLPLAPTSILVDQVNEAGRWSKLPVHPGCFRPSQPMPIHCPKQVPQEVESMVQAWNRQFDLEDYAEKYQVVEVAALEVQAAWAGTLRRCWLEVLKFLKPEEVAVGLARVSREMYLYAWDTELWGAAPGDLGSSDVGRRRACYILSQLQKCVSCGENRLCRLIRCPILGKPICIICRENPALRGNKRYSLKPVGYLLKKYAINRSVLDAMQVPITFDKRRQARAYDYMAEAAARSYNESVHGHTMVTRKKARRPT